MSWVSWTLDVPCRQVLAVCLLMIFSLLFHWYLRNRKRKGRLPGPFPWPVIGNLLQVRNNAHLKLNKMREIYGDVFSIKFFSRSVVVVSGQTAVDECLNSQSVLFSARPELAMSQFVLQGKSLTFARMDVSTHKQYRHLALCALREVTRTKTRTAFQHRAEEDGTTSNVVNSEDRRSHIEQLLLEEGKKLGKRLVAVGELHNQDVVGLTASVKYEILSTVCNINASVLWGQRYGRHDSQLKRMVNATKGLQTSNASTTLLNFMPSLIKILRPAVNSFVQLNESLENDLKTQVQSRRQQTESCNGHGNKNGKDHNSVLDYLLKVLDDDKLEQNYETDRTLLLVGDLLGAGTDTISVAFAWLIVYAATFPEVQKRVRREIETFQQEFDRLPTYAERCHLPYIMAYITEVLRHSSFVPFTIPHSPHNHGNLCGFHITEGTVMMISLWSINRDPDLWEQSDKFRPERFINRQGEFDRTKADRVNVFGGGRRRCAGEHLARIELFLMVVALFKEFRFERLGGQTNLPDTELSISIHPKVIDVRTIEIG